MRKLIAWAFMYSLDGLLADEGTEYWRFCFGLPVDPASLKQKIDVYESAYAHIMGRVSYEAMSGALPTADHPFSGIMNAARKVVFPRTLKTVERVVRALRRNELDHTLPSSRCVGSRRLALVTAGLAVCSTMLLSAPSPFLYFQF
jgi:hypothetical protein